MRVFHRTHSGFVSVVMHVFNQTTPDSVASHSPHITNLLINTRNNPPRHKLHIPVPILTILPPALFFVAALPMHQQDGKIHHEEIREDHAPAFSAVGHNVLAIAVSEKVGVGLRGGDGVLRCIADHVAGHGSREHV